MQPFHPESFDREMACTEREWRDGLPRAMGDHPYQQVAQALTARIDRGQLVLSWRVLEPRGAGALQAPRLLVSFRFSGLDALQRYRFMQRFELAVRRGGD